VEEENQNGEHIEQQKTKLKSGFSTLIAEFWMFTKSVLNLQNGLDRKQTVEGILGDVEFRGHAAWILVCSILIACIGLSDNNIPIIVGAMLISPLMGPILGIGLAAGTNDFDLLKKSLINYGVAFVISLIISTLYFMIIPVPEATTELIGRKSATVLAIAIAFLGGAAGIIAGSRGSKSNVVPGVAIATALMPPMCTVGYGLATKQWDFTFGALYLFFINSVFIAIPTYLYIKYMRFPVKEFIDPQVEKKIKRYIGFFLLFIAVPSTFFFYSVLSDTVYKADVKQFVQFVDHDLDKMDANLVSNKIIDNDSLKYIKIGLMGEPIPDRKIKLWKEKLLTFGLENTKLIVVQNDNISQVLHDFKENSIDENQAYLQKIITANKEEIRLLKEQLPQVNIIPNWSETEKEVRILFPQTKKIGYANIIQSDSLGMFDTIPTFFVQWNDEIPVDSIKIHEDRIADWLKVKLNEEQLIVVKY